MFKIKIIDYVLLNKLMIGKIISMVIILLDRNNIMFTWDHKINKLSDLSIIKSRILQFLSIFYPSHFLPVIFCM